MQRGSSILTVLVFAAEIAVAATPEPEGSVAAPVTSPVVVRDYGRSKLRDLADRIDRLFGTERDDENRSESTLRLIANNKWSEGQPNTTEFDARFALKLATLQRWEKSIQDWFNERLLHIKKQITPAKSTDQSAQETLAPEAIEEKDPWRFTVEHRFRVALQNQYDAQAILSRDFEGHIFLHHFEANVGWSMENLWESRSRIISKLSLNPKLLFQFSNSASWRISRQTFTTGHGPSLTYALNPKQAISVSLTLGASIAANVWAAQGYTIAASYRLQAYGDWIFLSFNPYLSYDRGNRFYRNPGFTSNLELVF